MNSKFHQKSDSWGSGIKPIIEPYGTVAARLWTALDRRKNEISGEKKQLDEIRWWHAVWSPQSSKKRLVMWYPEEFYLTFRTQKLSKTDPLVRMQTEMVERCDGSECFTLEDAMWTSFLVWWPSLRCWWVTLMSLGSQSCRYQIRPIFFCCRYSQATQNHPIITLFEWCAITASDDEMVWKDVGPRAAKVLQIHCLCLGQACWVGQQALQGKLVWDCVIDCWAGV